MFEKIDKDYIRVHEFLGDGVQCVEDRRSQNQRLRPGDSVPPSMDHLANELRKKFIRIVADAYRNDFRKLDASCDISEASMRKYIRGTRKITRLAVAKLCVGTSLPLEQSMELFRLQGHSLEPENFLFDALVVDNLKHAEGIGVFYEECKEFGLGIFD